MLVESYRIFFVVFLVIGLFHFRFIHVVAIWQNFLPLSGWVTFYCVQHFAIRSLVSGHLGSSHVLVVVNSAAVHTVPDISLKPSFQFVRVYTQMQNFRIIWSYSFNFGGPPYCFPQQHKGFNSYAFLQTFVFCLFFF